MLVILFSSVECIAGIQVVLFVGLLRCVEEKRSRFCCHFAAEHDLLKEQKVTNALKKNKRNMKELRKIHSFFITYWILTFEDFRCIEWEHNHAATQRMETQQGNARKWIEIGEIPRGGGPYGTHGWGKSIDH